MTDYHKITQTFQSQPFIEGAGVHLKRAFGYAQAPRFDPFLMLDDFHSDQPEQYQKGFPWHPHRGIETITYLLEGSIEHGDSMGNKGEIKAGDVQWMTAGSGIIHQEMPKGDSTGRLWGFQLWANLPAADKMRAPRYQEVKAEEIPTVQLAGGGLVKVICGEFQGVRGPVQDIVTDPAYLDIIVPADSDIVFPTPKDHLAFIYMLEGKGCFEPTDNGAGAFYEPEALLLFQQGEAVSASTRDDPARFLMISGRPIGQPVAWGGPIVMNTREELDLAFREYENGTFIKHD